MPNKYSHGLVFYHQQHPGLIPYDPSLSSKPPSSRNSRSHTRSTAPATRSSSNHSTQSHVHSHYLRLEPDPEPEPSYRHRSSAYTSRLSFNSIPSDAAPLQSASSEKSRPPSDRLRLESPFGFRIENPPSPAPQVEPKISDRPQCEPIPSHCPDAESSPTGRIRLESPSRLYSRISRPSLHHKSSSVETQIYAPEPTTSSSSTREGRNIISVETHEPYPSFRHRASSTSTQKPQHVFSMDSPESSSPPPISTGNRRERSSSESQGVHLPSPTRDRRQRFIRETQNLASPPLVQGRLAQSPFGTEETPVFPSARELQDYFSIAAQGLQSAPSAPEDRQDIPPQDAHVRPSIDMQRPQSPHRTKGYQRRRFSGTQDFSSDRQPQISQESANARRKSIDSQSTQDRQVPPSGLQHLSSDQSIQGKQYSRRASIGSKAAQEHRPRPSSSSQQLSLKQFIQESEHMWEASNTSHFCSGESSSSYTPNPNSSQTMSVNAQEYTPNSTRLEHSPRSRRDRPSKLPDTFASQHKILLPTMEGVYDNVMVETHGFPPERPPSPPATPDSGKSFSPVPQTQISQKTRPPPIPQRSARRSPPRQHSILSSTNSSIVYLPSEPPRPKTSSAMDPPRPKTSSAIDPPRNWTKPTALHSPTFSISTRRSSINATMSPQSVSFSDFSETLKSPRRVSFSQSRDREYFEDADLESLPPDIDFNVLPYENPNAGPAVFRATQLGLENPVSPRYEGPNIEPVLFPTTQSGLEKSVSHERPVSSRASSFDSAAPPPIGLNRRISHAAAESYEPKTPKKESRMSLISFLRSAPTPKAVLYSEATQGKPPVAVSVSRTAVPSIPLLFPQYRGQFPPPQKMQDKKDLKAGPEPRMRPGSDARISGARSTAHVDAAEKRNSWLKGDDVDKNRGANRPAPASKWELERILSNI